MHQAVVVNDPGQEDYGSIATERVEQHGRRESKSTTKIFMMTVVMACLVGGAFFLRGQSSTLKAQALAIDVQETGVADDLSVGSTRVTSTTRWPFQVLVKTTKSGRTYKCSGAILSSNFIITAGHCVKGVTASSVQVIAGRVNEAGSGGQVRTGQTVYMKNPSSTTCDDIALVKLSSSFSFGSSVNSIQLTRQRVPDNTGVYVVGWGNYNYLTEAMMDTKAGSSCSVPLRGSCTVKEVCAKDRSGNVCSGDSGGPMFRRTTSGTCYLQALTKRGSGLGCSDRSQDDVFTSVFEYKSWITGIISG